MFKNKEVQQAYALSNEKKQHALNLYRKAVIELVNKNYVMRVADAHTELSAIFGVDWLFTKRGNGNFLADKKLYAEANVAFNYANFTLGIKGKFVDLAKSLVNDTERLNDIALQSMAKQMNSILTATTASAFDKQLAFA